MTEPLLPISNTHCARGGKELSPQSRAYAYLAAFLAAGWSFAGPVCSTEIRASQSGYMHNLGRYITETNSPRLGRVWLASSEKGSGSACSTTPVNPSASSHAQKETRPEDSREAPSGPSDTVISRMQSIIHQNTPGLSEGRPVGVPTSYSWYHGTVKDTIVPPPGFTAVEGWGAVYQDKRADMYSKPDAKVYVANAKTYVRHKATGEWMLVQDQTKSNIEGGHFVTDFAGNAATELDVVKQADGSAAFLVPTTKYNDHFWFGARGAYAAGTVDAVYTQFDMRVDDPNLNLVANVGADWWRDARAPYVDGFGNNPGVGMSNWVKLSTEWKTIGFYSISTSEFEAVPPPPHAAPSSGTRSGIVSAREAQSLSPCNRAGQ